MTNFFKVSLSLAVLVAIYAIFVSEDVQAITLNSVTELPELEEGWTYRISEPMEYHGTCVILYQPTWIESAKAPKETPTYAVKIREC